MIALSTGAGWLLILALVIPTIVIFGVVLLRALVQASARWVYEARQDQRPSNPPWPPPTV